LADRFGTHLLFFSLIDGGTNVMPAYKITKQVWMHMIIEVTHTGKKEKRVILCDSLETLAMELKVSERHIKRQLFDPSSSDSCPE
jgi:hypothetical protein